MRHWSTTSTDRFWLVKAASILFRMVGPTGNRVGTKQVSAQGKWEASATLLPLWFWWKIAQQHPPRSAATGLPLVTTNSYLLRDWSSSHPTGWRLERVAAWTSTTTANSVATQKALLRWVLLFIPLTNPPQSAAPNYLRSTREKLQSPEINALACKTSSWFVNSYG